MQALIVMLSAILCLVLSSPIPRNSDMNNELTPYIDKFIKQVSFHYKSCWKNRKIEIRIGKISDIYPDISQRVIGVCNMLSKKIVIDVGFFAKANTYEKEEVIFHELGHCFLNRDHTEEKIDNRPYSLMHPILLNREDYKQYHSYYMNELFENSVCN